ncbi:helix-turn-helix transcriptional regulator [Vibrio parahaemolyticus]|uniref:helix-turn-helix domain-containing protein n=1 Tax=Vibrio parahaemolyticus TaxID=670 RepID=UPI000531A025|nr:helix-turn-helix transcriptional regulator [Vibrio parahaemolyticus]EGQ7795908.1 helix-turn-helix transcriptional regulator [Vibrio parahaemolyticus]EGQ7810485.1 helix-turn-helix transcriptional regulator [Vibrio parahaemolyticus]EJB8505176.1 helix-turn-helix transcriptional regulator [Vibrio parahaemolyticus]EJB8691157.1 helix-turn-helix transcriptional regulator [Vibrio parahaemolyticus]EJL3960072.1 helix-turn-helix transcriptional regulator [Vibrio parahaemolyticus]
MSVDELREKLNLYLANSGLSDSEIARRIGVNRVSVGKWRKTGKISKENLSKLCQELGVSEQDFFSNNPTSDLPQKKLAVIQQILLLENRDAQLLDELDQLLKQEKID